MCLSLFSSRFSLKWGEDVNLEFKDTSNIDKYSFLVHWKSLNLSLKMIPNNYLLKNVVIFQNLQLDKSYNGNFIGNIQVYEVVNFCNDIM